MQPPKTGIQIALVAISLICISSAQGAGSPGEGYPMGIAGHLFFTSVTTVASSDQDSALLKIHQVTQVDEETAMRFLASMESALQSMKQLAPEFTTAFCARRSELATLEELARALTAEDASYEARRTEIVEKAITVLGPDGMQNLRSHLVAKHKDVRYEPDNHVALLSGGDFSVDSFFGRRCGTSG